MWFNYNVQLWIFEIIVFIMWAKLANVLLPEMSIPVVQWLSYSPLDPRFAGSIPTGVDGFFQSVIILSMTSFGREIKPWVPCRRYTARNKPQAEIRASEQNLSVFSLSTSEERWWPKMLKSVVKPNNKYNSSAMKLQNDVRERCAVFQLHSAMACAI